MRRADDGARLSKLGEQAAAGGGRERRIDLGEERLVGICELELVDRRVAEDEHSVELDPAMARRVSWEMANPNAGMHLAVVLDGLDPSLRAKLDQPVADVERIRIGLRKMLELCRVRNVARVREERLAV